MAIALHYAARSDVGLVRQENQDSGYAGPHLLIVADGMGGHAAGDVASSIAIGEMVSLDGESPGADEALDRLAEALRSANSELRNAVERQPELKGMGTTVTALLRTGNKIAVAHIGDSRAYLLRDGTLTQITHDHSFVQSLVDEGRITEAEAEGHPQRSLVTRVLTGQHEDEPDLAMREAHVGDRYLICSDGLSGFVARDTIEEILVQAQPPALTADRLVELAMRAGAPDNVTCIIGDVVDLDKDQPPSTAQEVVGAAAERRIMTTRAMPVTPAAKAAALSREALGTEVSDTEEAESGRLADPGRRSGRWRWVKVVSLVLLVLVAAVGGGYAAYAWSQQQYYVGEANGHVAIYQGVSQNVGPWKLSHPIDQSDIALSDLPDFYRGKLDSTVSTASIEDARRLVTDLRVQAIQCQTTKAAGGTCGTSGP
ncbi:MAG TPA: Stp1/IreP family PP2C-type Ser/Thr phosphatase [Dermatophilaceae bacterium]|nr:Stp1/IreP family PP2C-type Ser/Thr phosphatase [Dermatophilaceae bacterium]